jgi:pyridoxamine 5'-phosphate oxidase
MKQSNHQLLSDDPDSSELAHSLSDNSASKIPAKIRDIRKQYLFAALDEHKVLPNGMEQFGLWLNEAIESELMEEPTAMILSTVDETGQPHSRVVLLKDITMDSFVFFSNYEGHKGQQMAQNKRVALVFFWPLLERQVRIEGTVEKISEVLSIHYFKSRPIENQLGAWASPQSQIIRSKEFLEQQFEYYLQKYGNEVPKPPHWGGYAVKPTSIEFWQGRPNRLHDRLLFTPHGNSWSISRLAP